MKKINGRGCIVEKCCVPRKKSIDEIDVMADVRRMQAMEEAEIRHAKELKERKK